MSDRESSLAEWRRQMLAAGITAPALLDELESHLEDAIERRMASGSTPAKAFAEAVRALGPAALLQEEFQKVEAAREERHWRQSRLLLVLAGGTLQIPLVGFVIANSEMTPGQRLSGLAAIAVSMLVAISVDASARIFPAISDRRARLTASFLAAIVPMGLWVSVGGKLWLEGHEFPFGAWLAAVLWICCPALAVSLGVISGFEKAARNLRIARS